MTIKISEISEGVLVRHKQSGEEKHVVGFVKNFDGNRDSVKLGWVDGDSSGVASVGSSQIANDELDEWEVVDE